MSHHKPGLFRLALHRIVGGPRNEPSREATRKIRTTTTYTLTGNVPPRFALIIPREGRR